MQEEQARQGARRLRTMGTRHAAATGFYLCGWQSSGLPPVWRQSKEVLSLGASCASEAVNEVRHLLSTARAVICPSMHKPHERSHAPAGA
jgi:hypothetical protein